MQEACLPLEKKVLSHVVDEFLSPPRMMLMINDAMLVMLMINDAMLMNVGNVDD